MQALILMLACEGAAPGRAELHEPVGAGSPAGRTEPLAVLPLEDGLLIRRLSLDLRGRLLSPDELAEVEAGTLTATNATERFLADEAFEGRFADLVAEQWLTRVDAFNVGAADFRLDVSLERALVEDVGNEVPVFLAAVAAEDLPWTDAVLADWTMTTDLLAQVWPVEAISGRASTVEGWHRARYTDGRPRGGVVMTNGLWWRYWSAPNNYNRTRAAAIGRLLLCDDWLTRPIHPDPSQSLQASSLESAVSTQTSCVGCHDTLDPVAATLFGFWWFDLYDPLEMRSYHAERELLSERYFDAKQAWFGKAMEGPADLGPRIAADPRFMRCTVQRMAQALWRRELGDDDFTTVTQLDADFAASDYRMRALLTALTAAPEYRAGSWQEGVDTTADVATRRVMQPSQLATAVEQLTGYAWSQEGYDQLANDEIGFRVLAGGVDGAAVTLPDERPSVTRSLVIQRLAQAAAYRVAAAEFALPADQRSLFIHAGDEDPPGSEAWVRQVEHLHLRAWGTIGTDADLAEEVALAEATLPLVTSEVELWATVLEVILRDPRFWTY